MRPRSPLLMAPFVALALTIASSSGAVTGSDIASLATKNLGKMACSTNSTGGKGFFIPPTGDGYDSCTGDGGQPEYWCADFVGWVWAQAGVNTAGVSPAAASVLYDYDGGHATKSTPSAGDAVVFASCAWGTPGCDGWDAIEHVAIVISVTTEGGKPYIETVSGDWGGSGATEPAFASTSHVVLNSPAYEATVGRYVGIMGMWIAGIVSPSGLTEAPPPPPPPLRGYLEDASCTTVDGWAEYEPTPSNSIAAEVSWNGALGSSGASAFRLTADLHGSSSCTATGYCGDHGFSMAAPRSLMDGDAHKVYAYAVNPVAGKPSALLTNAPKSMTCTAPAIPAGQVKRHVTSPTILGDWKFDTFTDEAPYKTAEIADVTTGVDLASGPSIVRVAGQDPIYVIDGSFKRGITDAASFVAWRMTAAEVKTVTASDLHAYDEGPSWPAAPLLIKDPTAPSVYMLDVALPKPRDGGGGGPPDSGPILGPDGSILYDGAFGPALDDAGLVLDASAGAGFLGAILDGSISSTPGAAPTPPPDASSGDASSHGSAMSSGGCSIGRFSGAGDGAWAVVLGIAALARRKRRAR